MEMNWISTAEQLPNVERFLYVSRFNDMIRISEKRYFDDEHIVGGLNIKRDILYWMPLPALPEV